MTSTSPTHSDSSGSSKHDGSQVCVTFNLLNSNNITHCGAHQAIKREKLLMCFCVSIVSLSNS